MKIIDNNLVTDIISENASERELVWVYKRIYKFTPYSTRPVPSTDTEYYEEISRILDRTHFNDIADRVQYIQTIKTECALNLLPKQEFAWIDPKNDRLCHWLWFSLMTPGKLATSINSSSNQKKKRDIVFFFDALKKSRFEKLKMLEELRKTWQKLSDHLVSDYRWLDSKNNLQCDWAISYLKKKQTDPLFPTYIVEPHYCKNTYTEIMATIDLHEAERADTSKLAEKMKVAWAQKKARGNIKQAASKVTPKLRQKTLLMLESISTTYKHKNINETLELLIKKENERLTNSWKTQT
jgi:hypothetical protein